MILQRLCEYYDRLAADPMGGVAPPGFTKQGIAFEVVLNEDGSLHAVHDLRDPKGGKIVPRPMVVPQGAKRTVAVVPQFLWDKPEYLLGWTPVGGKGARVAQCHAACRELHLKAGIDDPEYAVLVRFFMDWKPDSLDAKTSAFLEEMKGGFGVFRVQGHERWLHERPAVVSYWEDRSGDVDAGARAVCLVTGRQAAVARLHPAIKGVAGGQTSGGSIVSFNQPSFESYGHTQGENAPVSELAAFKYTTALNHLLRAESGRSLRIRDTTVVFWADAPIAVDGVDGEDLFKWGLDASGGEDRDLARSLGRAFERIRAGTIPSSVAGTGFHVLGLAPNAARVSVRFWLEGTFAEFLEHVRAHQDRLAITGGHEAGPPLPLWRLTRQTVRDSKDVSPLLAGALVRAVLTGGRYPDMLLPAVLRRIRSEGDLLHPKAAVIKAVLTRNHAKEVPSMLDPQRPEVAYQLGRLFAALERTQEDALPGINATLKDRFFGAASATPAVVFPRLLRLSQHHAAKLEVGRKIHAEKRTQEIVGHIDAFPGHLDLVGQGLFAIGYYHQRQAFFKPKPLTDNEREATTAGA